MLINLGYAELTQLLYRPDNWSANEMYVVLCMDSDELVLCSELFLAALVVVNWLYQYQRLVLKKFILPERQRFSALVLVLKLFQCRVWSC